MRYMICLDFSPSSVKAFDTAFKMIDPTKDEVLLVNIVEVYTHSIMNTLKVDWDYQILDEANDKMMKDSQKLMATYAQKFADAKIKHEIIVEAGNPRESIVDLTEKNNVDYLLIGSRGLSAVQKLVTGSVSDYCLRHAKAGTVLLVH